MTQLSTEDPTWPQEPAGGFELESAEPSRAGVREWFFRIVPAYWTALVLITLLFLRRSAGADRDS